MLKDFNLLKTFDALWRLRNVSHAAKFLKISQPAMSQQLIKLRDELGDDLFVRVGRGMAPTPKALQWAPALQRALNRLELELVSLSESTHDRAERISIMATDLIESTLFPKLISLVQTERPSLTLVMRSTLGEFPKSSLELGQLDFVLAGFYGTLTDGFYQQLLQVHPYQVIARKDHPRIKDKLSLEQFCSEQHVLTSPQGDLWGVVDKELADKNLKRRVIAGVACFQSLGTMVESSDALATLPERMALHLVKRYNLKIFAPPLKLPPIRLQLIWHARTHHSQTHEYLRHVIAKSLANPV
jgi:DNA-binding transcriptional LysR family regulator